MITILLATYNGEAYLPELLTSIEGQTCADWRLVVSDDASTDNTRHILTDFQTRHPGRVDILRPHKRLGSAKANFLYLLQQVEDDYLMFCDQDDVWQPNKIARTFALMRSTEGADRTPVLIHGDLTVTDENLTVTAESLFELQELDPRTDTAHLLIQNCVTGCTVMINRALRDIAVRGTDASRMLMHDHWLGLCASVYGTIGFIPEPLILYRQHGDNSVGAKSANDPERLIERLRAGREAYMAGIREEAEQAAYLAEIMAGTDAPQDKKALVSGFAVLPDRNWFRRHMFYMKHRVYKSGRIRRLAQFFWG